MKIYQCVGEFGSALHLYPGLHLDLSLIVCFIKIIWRTSVLFVGSLIPLFWTSGDVCPGFQCVQWILQIHLWCDTCWLLGGQHVVRRHFTDNYLLILYEIVNIPAEFRRGVAPIVELLKASSKLCSDVTYTSVLQLTDSTICMLQKIIHNLITMNDKYHLIYCLLN